MKPNLLNWNRCISEYQFVLCQHYVCRTTLISLKNVSAQENIIRNLSYCEFSCHSQRTQTYFKRCCPMTSKCSAVSPNQIHGAFGWTKYWATWFRYCIVHSCCYYCCGCTSIYSKCDVNSFYLAVDINPSITWQISPYQMSVCFFGRSTNTIQKTWMICTRLYAVVIWDLSVAIQIGLP